MSGIGALTRVVEALLRGGAATKLVESLSPQDIQKAAKVAKQELRAPEVVFRGDVTPRTLQNLDQHPEGAFFSYNPLVALSYAGSRRFNATPDERRRGVLQMFEAPSKLRTVNISKKASANPRAWIDFPSEFTDDPLYKDFYEALREPYIFRLTNISDNLYPHKTNVLDTQLYRPQRPLNDLRELK